MIAWETVFPFWNSLSDLQQQEILDCIIIRQYSEGERIKKRQGLYIVDEGRIVLYMAHGSGRKRVILNGIRSEVIYLTNEFLSTVTDMSLEMCSRTDSEIYYLPEEAWHKFEENNEEIRKYAMDLLSTHMASLSNKLYLGMENIGRQLAMFLLRFSIKNNQTVIDISHEEIAEQLGTTREVITRNMSLLKNLNLVETGRNKVRILDVEQMQEYIRKENE